MEDTKVKKNTCKSRENEGPLVANALISICPSDIDILILKLYFYAFCFHVKE